MYLTARGPTVMSAVIANSGRANLPESEIWSYQSNDRLRVTAAEGLPPVDPVQVEVPANWRSFPAFRVDEGASLAITERSRGVVSASNELSLDRTLWLDFDGGGFIVEDRIAGEMRTDWRLDMAGPYSLLSASEYGESLLITNGESSGQSGIEVRQSVVDLETLGRSDTRGAMPVTGWDARFANVSAKLNVPPGHKLLTASGVDDAYGSWMGEWQLLDFFLVLIITIAVWRLFTPVAGVVALAALILSFHELFAPTWLWLNLLAAIALLRVAPEGRLYKIVRSYQLLSALALVIALVPFIAGQLRVAIYPQLESQYSQYGLTDYDATPAGYDQMTDAEPYVAEKKASLVARSRPVESTALEEVIVTGSMAVQQKFSRYAPNAIVQAGPGIPSWRWNTYSLNWSGPVDPDQAMRLVVLPRWLVSALRFVEVALMLLFAGVLAAEIANKRWTLPGGLTLGRGPGASVVASGLCMALLMASPAADAQMPDAELLQQLEQRLLEPPDCVPRCAEIASASVQVGETAVSMTLSIHALENVALPMPGSTQGWRPNIVLVDGSSNSRVLRASNGTYWLYVTPGRHTVTLRGPIPAADNLEVPFRTPPRVISVAAEGWFVAGIKDRRLLSGSLQFTRLQTEEGGDTVRWESSRFPAFARIERSIELDLDWRVRTTVYRVAPEQGAMTLEVPLIEGESIVSGNFTVRDGSVLVSMNPQQRSISWTSNLPLTSPLTLRAPGEAPWKETWKVAVGNIWHANFDGVPESITGAQVADIRIAEFGPRAGEQLVITATRPEASAGSTLAFDSVSMAVDYGNHSSDVSMSLAYRATRGAQHVVRLPDDAEVTSVLIDGREQTLRAEDGNLTLPILPGEHSITVDWRASGGMGIRTLTPEVDLGAPASNIELLATTGPQLGPAVMYWPELAALVLFALILGRIGIAPLNTWHWLLLGLGFSTFSWPVLALVAVWLLVCGLREKIKPDDLNWWRFNAVQVVVGGLTVIALLAIVTTLPQGLLGTPDMHIAGHNSYGTELGWFADRSESVLPLASAFTVPMWIYKVLILAWALWLSFALLSWLRWVWQRFSSNGFWR